MCECDLICQLTHWQRPSIVQVSLPIRGPNVHQGSGHCHTAILCMDVHSMLLIILLLAPFQFLKGNPSLLNLVWKFVGNAVTLHTFSWLQCGGAPWSFRRPPVICAHTLVERSEKTTSDELKVRLSTKHNSPLAHQHNLAAHQATLVGTRPRQRL